LPGIVSGGADMAANKAVRVVSVFGFSAVVSLENMKAK